MTLLALGNLQGAGFLADRSAAQASLPEVARPECNNRMMSGTQLILEAQSVPSAEQIPCLESLPLGWSFRALEVKDGMSRLVLDSDRAGVEAADVTLAKSCDVSDAIEVPSDEPRTRRYEQIQTLGNRYEGLRFYTFDGGCATYRFDFSGEGRTS